jgi:gamma-glutamyltranspeptidase/glutathione hydrolase
VGPLAPSQAAPTGRSPVYARGGVVATSQPLATAAGLEVLARGGNAADAAVAVLGALAVLEPMMNGLGGDVFALHYRAADRRVTALCGSGASARLGTPEAYGNPARMPLTGLRAAAVPGMVAATCELLRRFGSGRLDLGALWSRAVEYAAEGFPLAPKAAAYFADAPPEFRGDGSPPLPGAILRQPDLAATLRAVATHGEGWFYRGPFAEALERACLAEGAFLRAEDLAAHETWVGDPLTLEVAGLRVCVPPPPSQGVILLEALGIAGAGPGDPMSAEGIHLLVEACKRAFADRLAYVGDPRFVPFEASRLLRPSYLAARRADIDPDRAAETAAPGVPAEGEGDTTSFVVVDRAGNAASVITSISAVWGCRVVVPGTGVLLNNRAGRGFTLEPGHPNRLAPGKRTMHTLLCWMALDPRGELVLLGGTPGGDGQPQWNLQVLAHLLWSGCDPQQAVERPRWRLHPGTDPETLPAPYTLFLEDGFPPDVPDRLGRLGHRVRGVPRWGGGGAVQLAVRAGPGVWAAGSDPRGDGCALGL